MRDATQADASAIRALATANTGAEVSYSVYFDSVCVQLLRRLVVSDDASWNSAADVSVHKWEPALSGIKMQESETF